MGNACSGHDSVPLQHNHDGHDRSGWNAFDSGGPHSAFSPEASPRHHTTHAHARDTSPPPRSPLSTHQAATPPPLQRLLSQKASSTSPPDAARASSSSPPILLRRSPPPPDASQVSSSIDPLVANLAIVNASSATLEIEATHGQRNLEDSSDGKRRRASPPPLAQFASPTKEVLHIGDDEVATVSGHPTPLPTPRGAVDGGALNVSGNEMLGPTLPAADDAALRASSSIPHPPRNASFSAGGHQQGQRYRTPSLPSSNASATTHPTTAAFQSVYSRHPSWENTPPPQPSANATASTERPPHPSSVGLDGSHPHQDQHRPPPLRGVVSPPLHVGTITSMRTTSASSASPARSIVVASPAYSASSFSRHGSMAAVYPHANDHVYASRVRPHATFGTEGDDEDDVFQKHPREGPEDSLELPAPPHAHVVHASPRPPPVVYHHLVPSSPITQRGWLEGAGPYTAPPAPETIDDCSSPLGSIYKFGRRRRTGGSRSAASSAGSSSSSRRAGGGEPTVVVVQPRGALSDDTTDTTLQEGDDQSCE